MRIALVCCLLTLAHIMYMTYLIYNPVPEEKAGADAQTTSFKQPELIYSTDGKYFVSVDYKNSNFKIIDIAKEKEIKNIKMETGINSVSFSKTGNTIEVIGNDNKTKLYNSETGKLAGTF